MYLLAGATFIQDHQLEPLRKSFSRVVSGRIANVYSKTDKSLMMFNLTFKQASIGRRPILQKSIANEASNEPGTKEFRLDNYDASTIVTGHMDYRKKLDVLLDLIKFN